MFVLLIQPGEKSLSAFRTVNAVFFSKEINTLTTTVDAFWQKRPTSRDVFLKQHPNIPSWIPERRTFFRMQDSSEPRDAAILSYYMLLLEWERMFGIKIDRCKRRRLSRHWIYEVLRPFPLFSLILVSFLLTFSETVVHSDTLMIWERSNEVLRSNFAFYFVLKSR